ncbi:MAG: hypothetical protein BWY74_02918 [Firmicutes bacterium ADurb.Bin419]|nr:MAG: hypothetical protein BWY74_02918 [Firmicutes bacterium ADurb.Bin419]
MDNKKISLSFKEYALLERSLRGDITLSQKLSSNQKMSKNSLIMELIEEIRSIEYDEGVGTPLEFRVYEDGRNLLKTITKKLYPNDEEDRYIGYLTSKKMIKLNDIEEDILVLIEIT